MSCLKCLMVDAFDIATCVESLVMRCSWYFSSRQVGDNRRENAITIFGNNSRIHWQCQQCHLFPFGCRTVFFASILDHMSFGLPPWFAKTGPTCSGKVVLKSFTFSNLFLFRNPFFSDWAGAWHLAMGHISELTFAQTMVMVHSGI